MLASKRRGGGSAEALPPPRQTLFAQLNVRIDPDLDARFRRYCQVTGTKQAKAVSEALEAFLEEKGH